MDELGFAQQKEVPECYKCKQREKMWERTKYVYVGKDGWPVAGFIGKPFKTWLRRLILSKKKVRYNRWLETGGFKIDFS